MGGTTPRLVVLARPDSALGFRLAGVPVVEAEPGREAEAFRDALASSAEGVVAAESDVLAAVADPDRGRSRGLVPLVLPFVMPRRFGESDGGRAWVAALVRRAIGYHVKLGEKRT